MILFKCAICMCSDSADGVWNNDWFWMIDHTIFFLRKTSGFYMLYGRWIRYFNIQWYIQICHHLKNSVMSFVRKLLCNELIHVYLCNIKNYTVHVPYEIFSFNKLQCIECTIALHMHTLGIKFAPKKHSSTCSWLIIPTELWFISCLLV